MCTSLKSSGLYLRSKVLYRLRGELRGDYMTKHLYEKTTVTRLCCAKRVLILCFMFIEFVFIHTFSAILQL